MLYFTQLPRRLLWTDFRQLWNRCSTRGSNQSLQIICQSVQGFDFTFLPTETDVAVITLLRYRTDCDNCSLCERSYLSCCNKLHTCHTRDGDILTVSTVDSAPRTVVTRINVKFVAIAHNIVQPNQFSTGTVGVANEPTAASSFVNSSSSSSNNNNNSRITAI